jgi:hypothetical protein
VAKNEVKKVCSRYLLRDSVVDTGIRILICILNVYCMNKIFIAKLKIEQNVYNFLNKKVFFLFYSYSRSRSQLSDHKLDKTGAGTETISFGSATLCRGGFLDGYRRGFVPFSENEINILLTDEMRLSFLQRSQYGPAALQEFLQQIQGRPSLTLYM